MPRARHVARALRCALAALAVCLVASADPTLDKVEQAARLRYDTQVVERVQTWRAALAGMQGKSEAEQLRDTNDFFNRQVQFLDDAVVWQQKDYWATPLEMLAKRAGDCEDFVIAKYLSLRQLGVADEKLRLIYVRAKIGGEHSSLTQAHMVLGYYETPTSEPRVLDNLVGDIQPASRRTDLFPVFSFNSSGLWVGGASTASARPTERLSRWRDLLARLRDEGFEQ
ncbi:transglutaminase-like cysteine peptidase [Denitromonas sp. IR12]|uniref:Transglutaminase-like cysteine peptidase n=1 Tax=Denitromonas iodatirespirans TaxID=2795389 RepID=A0A944DHE2_DENI1|nr:transglutaminase-like cysteine peptidase [Denitromonas iodatirespirans]